MVKKVLFLGPAGSYSDAATRRFKQYFDKDCEYETIDSIYRIMRILKENPYEEISAVIPIENSIEGVVRDTQDNLAGLAENGIRILAETRLAIEHSLIGFGIKSEITEIASHPQALAQCREYIHKNWNDNVTLNPVLSTSGAVKSLNAKAPDKAAIGSKYCADLYNIPVIESKINDEENNTTRFVLLSKTTPKKTAANKVSITFSTENKPGTLNRVLSIFEKYELNLSYIDSRPSRRELGEYVFYADFAGHIEDSNVSLALTEIQPFIKMFEVLSEGAECV